MYKPHEPLWNELTNFYAEVAVMADKHLPEVVDAGGLVNTPKCWTLCRERTPMTPNHNLSLAYGRFTWNSREHGSKKNGSVEIQGRLLEFFSPTQPGDTERFAPLKKHVLETLVIHELVHAYQRFLGMQVNHGKAFHRLNNDLRALYGYGPALNRYVCAHYVADLKPEFKEMVSWLDSPEHTSVMLLMRRREDLLKAMAFKEARDKARAGILAQSETTKQLKSDREMFRRLLKMDDRARQQS